MKKLILFSLLFCGSLFAQTRISTQIDQAASLPVEPCTPGRNFIKTGTNAGQYYCNASSVWVRLVHSVGVTGDGRVATDCSMTSSSATLTCTSSAFASTDVGKVIAVYGAGPTTNGFVQPLSTTISAYVSATQVTLAAAATNSVTNSERVVWGTDNTVALQSAVDAAAASNGLGENVGGMVLIPAGHYLTNGVTMNCAAIGTWSGNVCTKTYHNIYLRGAGAEQTLLENWDVAASTISRGLIAIGLYGETPGIFGINKRVRNIRISDLGLYQVKHPNTQLWPLLSYATQDVEIWNTRATGYSHEGYIMGGGAKSFRWRVHDNVFDSCGNGGPAYGLATAAINLNGTYVECYNNVVSNSGQAIEMGTRYGHFYNNTLLGGSAATPSIGINVGSTGSGIWENICENNLIKDFTNAFIVANGIGSINRTFIKNNTLINSGSIALSSGRDTNSVVSGGISDSVIHGTSHITGNVFINTGATTQSFVDLGELVAAYSGLESIVIANNTASWETQPTHAITVNGTWGGGAAWAASTAYTLNDFRVPTVDNDFYYKITTAGTSDTAEPTWPTTVGNTVTDGTVIWTCAGKRPTLQIVNNTFNVPASATTWDAAISYRQSSSRYQTIISNIVVNIPWRIQPNSPSDSPDETNIPAGAAYGDMNRFFDTLPTAGYFKLGARITKPTTFTTGAGGQGWVVTRAGYAAATYSTGASYSAFGTRVVPTVDNGKVYQLISGSCGATAEPDWPAIGSTVSNNGCTWKGITIAVQFTAVP